MRPNILDLVIIGSGQSGLAAAYYAAQRGLNYNILEAGDGAGQSWKNRYDSLVLFTPRRYSNLPGLSLDGDPDGYPTKDEVATYLQNYAEHFHLNVKPHQPIVSLSKKDRLFTVRTPTTEYKSRAIVVATGPFQTPRIPSWSTKLTMPNIHSASYRNSSQLPSGKVLVVGAGNSGAQIAEGLAISHEVTLAGRGKPVIIPRSIAGKSLFWWLDKLHLLNAPMGSLRAKLIVDHKEPVIGTTLPALMKEGRVRIKPEAVDGSGNSVTFADGSTEQFASVVWSTGYTTNYSWLDIPGALDTNSHPLHIHGKATRVDDLYFLGLSWLRSRNSALIGGVGADAKFIFDANFN